MRVLDYGFRMASTAINSVCQLGTYLRDVASVISPSYSKDAAEQLTGITSGYYRRGVHVRNATGMMKGDNLMTPESVIKMLKLQPLPGEGGFYRETYRSQSRINVRFQTEASDVERTVSTAIYYMVTPTNFSALHRIKQDEVYHFYMGEPVELLMITETGGHRVEILGNSIMEGQQPQVVIPAMTWQGVKLRTGSKGWALLGTTVAPGFEFSDFELGARDELLERFPDISELVKSYTRL